MLKRLLVHFFKRKKKGNKMGKIIITVVVVAVCAAAIQFGCSKSDRTEMMDRLRNAGNALKGDSVADGQGTPKIVANQQRKERIRQDTTWTKENQALHPIEYCQAQLEELNRYAAQLEVTAHEVAVGKSATMREINDAEMLAEQLSAFVADAKQKYKECETAGADKIALGGFSLTLGRAREKMVDAARRIPVLKAKVGTKKNLLVKLDKKGDLVMKEQKRLVSIRERIENTISDLKLKKVIEGEKSVTDALNAINDSMADLGVDYDDPTIEEIVQPAESANIDEEFKKLMSE